MQTKKKSAGASFRRRQPRCDYRTTSVSSTAFRKITTIVDWAEFGPALKQKWTTGSIAFCKKAGNFPRENILYSCICCRERITDL